MYCDLTVDEVQPSVTPAEGIAGPSDAGHLAGWRLIRQRSPVFFFKVQAPDFEALGLS